MFESNCIYLMSDSIHNISAKFEFLKIAIMSRILLMVVSYNFLRATKPWNGN